MRILSIFPLVLLLSAPSPAFAQVAAADSGDTGWMILCALLLLFAALPGLMLRHAGQVNVRNILSVMAQGAGVAAIMSVGWAIAGYSLAFAPGNAWLGGGANLLLANLAQLRDGLTVPESAFVLFQLALALVASCLLVGSVAERARIGWFLAFIPLWLLLVYAPMVHALWAGGWLAALGVMDYAGGIATHVAAGFSALALALLAGRRSEISDPGHAPGLTMAGGALVWIGLSGAVGGWALGATDDAATAILNHHFAACTGALAWALFDRVLTGRTSATGVMSGALAGIAAVSASAALVGTGGAMLTGVIAATICRIATGLLAGRIDDGANIFAIHGLGGMTGGLLLPIFALPILGGVGFDPSISFSGAMVSQIVGISVVALWSVLGSAIAALIVSMVLPLRVTKAQEGEGLDAAVHGQQGWDFR
ncbi:Amt family ammonium transporter [Sphingobium sp. OAS761]|uniref:ammonium transporter n=1 Tax=Sphingobium sp. OAS761 TaxID=2817901 RepID=UPI00209D97DE|nr:ammonium transporter [Sphingobium sp. OAS761]MCP1472130.1 Amt family ammonium transporter [Sphingobium sp. OAS761]